MIFWLARKSYSEIIIYCELIYIIAKEKEKATSNLSSMAPSLSPRDERSRHFRDNRSVAPAWDRLAKPRFISPKIPANLSMSEYDLSKFPAIKSNEVSLMDQKQAKKNNSGFATSKKTNVNGTKILKIYSPKANCELKHNQNKQDKERHNFSFGDNKFETRLLSYDMGIKKIEKKHHDNKLNNTFSNIDLNTLKKIYRLSNKPTLK